MQPAEYNSVYGKTAAYPRAAETRSAWSCGTEAFFTRTRAGSQVIQETPFNEQEKNIIDAIADGLAFSVKLDTPDSVTATAMLLETFGATLRDAVRRITDMRALKIDPLERLPGCSGATDIKSLLELTPYGQRLTALHAERVEKAAERERVERARAAGEKTE